MNWRLSPNLRGSRSGLRRLTSIGGRQRKKPRTRTGPMHTVVALESTDNVDHLYAFIKQQNEKGPNKIHRDYPCNTSNISPFSRVVGKFKGAIKAYRLPLPRDLDDHTVMGHDPQTGGFFQVYINQLNRENVTKNMQ